MRNFDSWLLRAERRATKRMWAGVVLVLMSLLLALALGSFVAQAGIFGPVFVQFRWTVLLPAAVGICYAAHGCWIAWCLHRDPVQLYHDHDGRMP